MDAISWAEVEDFLDRHADAIADAIREPAVLHSPRCTFGKRQWIFSWRWPFVTTWISQSVCLCEINEIMRGHREMNKLIAEITVALDELGQALIK